MLKDELLRYKKDLRITWIDLETCNLNLHKSHNYAWQMSMIKTVGDKVEKEIDYYIKWPFPINVSRGAAIATRYDPEIVRQLGRPPEEVARVMLKELKDADIIGGHNIMGFDAYIIIALLEQVGLPSYNIIPKALDTLALARAMRMGVKYEKGDDFAAWQYRLVHTRLRGSKNSLGALGKEFNIEHNYNMLHNSLVDLRLNAKVLNALKWQIEI